MPRPLVPLAKTSGANQRHPAFFWAGWGFAATLVLVFVAIYGRAVYQLDWWKSYFFADAVAIGETCAVASAGTPDEEFPASLLDAPLAPLAVPHASRAVVDRMPPDAAHFHARYVCTGQAGPVLLGKGTAYVHLGWIFARRAEVLVNGAPRASMRGANDKPIVALTEADLTAPTFTIEVRASAPRQAHFGMASAQPMTVVAGPAQNQKIMGIETALQSVKRLYDLLPLMTFALVLAAGWFLGLRARLLVAAFFYFALAAARVLVIFLSDFWPWEVSTSYAAKHPLDLGAGLAFVLFGMELLALRPRWIYRGMLATVAAVALGELAVALAPDLGRLYELTEPVYHGILCLAVAAFLWGGLAKHRRAADATGAQRKIRLAFLAFAALFLGAQILESLWSALEINLPYLTRHVTVLMPLFLGVTVLFQLTLTERELHEERARRVVLDERIKLGRAVQELLLPRTMQGDVGPYRYRLIHQPAEQLSGDWVQCQRVDGALRIVMGDVVGKGPQAALAVSTVYTVLYDAERTGLSVEATITKLNDTLLGLFGGHITTTLTALVVAETGEVRLYNCGGMGWLLVGDGEASRLAATGHLLGAEPMPRVGTAEAQPGPGQWLVAFSDGVIDGTKAIHKMLRAMPKDPGAWPSPEALVDYVVAFGKDHALPDDRTMVVLGHRQTARLRIAG